MESHQYLVKNIFISKVFLEDSGESIHNKGTVGVDAEGIHFSQF